MSTVVLPEKYLELFEKLEHEISNGDGESQYANNLRDRMDNIWMNLNDKEQSDIRVYFSIRSK